MTDSNETPIEVTPTEYIEDLIHQITDPVPENVDEAIADFAKGYLDGVKACGDSGIDNVPESFSMAQFVTVSCEGDLLSHAFDHGEDGEGADLLNRTMDLSMRHGVHVKGYYRATLVIDPDSFVPVTMADHEACAERFVIDEKAERNLIEAQLADLVMSQMDDEDDDDDE